ncbi:hypothetical protein LSTR_LSTR010439 [Laodelphax striatellus]|uniref:Uncharacterized protein n=1 Tax=Laodelphax striatellus TaxID=195883 RepID=A0A482WV10_LAOST|nr:hypothetical protein LSTR_LSTR010439 [Laodelphax striatellus]
MTGDIVFVIHNQEAGDNPSKSGSLLKSSLGRKKIKNGQCFYGTIKRVHLRDIVFECEDLSDVHKPYFKYNIQFSLNRFIYRLCYRALNLLNDNLLRILLPQGKYRKSYEKRELVFFNEDIAGNPEQVQAITNIVSRSCTPFPYIVFGPPGTGKTKTLVEAILQNWAVGKFQLVCASSNSAADVLVKEILKLANRNAYLNFEPAGNILRIYSASVEIGTVSETILNLQIHNFRATNEAKFPLMSVVLKTPIVVGTLATAARLSLEGVPANHFSHVYVDECGHCSEPECILAVSGIIAGNSVRSSGEGLNGFWGEPPAPFETQLVLAGDPQQLGSTAHCNLSQMYNYGYSLLERLLNTTDMYQRDGRTGKYNGEVITKLSRNYRSHADIINISNQLFYHGELLESGKPEILNSCSEIDFLPQKNHPVIFHGVTGLEEQDNTSPSYYNLNEVDQVVTYISMLIEEANEKKLKFTLKDIGVVTPYKKQVQKLAQTFSDLKWEDVAVGSVDLFQGSEKLIIIISTVRASCTLKNSSGKSAPRQMDFVNDAKRFNVALTRAKALLIVIGDPEILQYQSYWKVYMDYCLDRGTYMGTIPAHYRQNNNLVKVTTPNHCSQKKTKAKKEKTTAKKEEVCMKTGGREKKTKKNRENGGGGDCAEEKSLGNLENSGGGDGCKVKSRKSVDVGKDDKKTFRDIIMDLDIEGYADANGTENEVSKKSVESLSNKTERNKIEEGENGGEEKGKREEEDGSGQQGEDGKRENGGENISENDGYDINENSNEGKEGEVGESVLKKKRIRNRKQTNVMKVGDNKELMENPLQGDGKLCNNNSESFKNEYSDGTENENDASRNHPKVGEIEQTLASLAISD